MRTAGLKLLRGFAYIGCVLALVVVLSGCLTMRRGSTQMVPIDSNPQGATVEVQPGGRSFETPAEVVLPRRYTQSLRFEKEGYQSQTNNI